MNENFDNIHLHLKIYTYTTKTPIMTRIPLFDVISILEELEIPNFLEKFSLSKFDGAEREKESDLF